MPESTPHFTCSLWTDIMFTYFVTCETGQIRSGCGYCWRLPTCGSNMVKHSHPHTLCAMHVFHYEFYGTGSFQVHSYLYDKAMTDLQCFPILYLWSNLMFNITAVSHADFWHCFLTLGDIFVNTVWNILGQSCRKVNSKLELLFHCCSIHEPVRLQLHDYIHVSPDACMLWWL